MAYLKKQSNIIGVLNKLAGVRNGVRKLNVDAIISELDKLNLNDESKKLIKACSSFNTANKELFEIIDSIAKKVASKKSKIDLNKITTLDEFEDAFGLKYCDEIKYFDDTDKLAYYYCNEEGWDEFPNIEVFIANYLNVDPDQKHLVVIDDDFENTKCFDSKEDALKFMIDYVKKLI